MKTGVSSFEVNPRCFACSLHLFLRLNSLAFLSKSVFVMLEISSIIMGGFCTVLLFALSLKISLISRSPSSIDIYGTRQTRNHFYQIFPVLLWFPGDIF